jgi:hypothetical protein
LELFQTGQFQFGLDVIMDVGEEESQEKSLRGDACERRERNGEAAPGNVCTQGSSSHSRWANGAG